MTDEQMFLALKELNDLQQQLEMLSTANRAHIRESGTWLPAYLAIFDTICVAQERFEERCLFFELWHGEGSDYHYVLIPKEED